MSNRERVIDLLRSVPDYKMGYVLAYVQGITADEEADDAFCQRMVENYENDPDPEKDKGYSLEDCKRECPRQIGYKSHHRYAEYSPGVIHSPSAPSGSSSRFLAYCSVIALCFVIVAPAPPPVPPAVSKA